MNHITIIAGARPNFMKVAPIIHEIKKRKAEGVDIDYSLFILVSIMIRRCQVTSLSN